MTFVPGNRVVIKCTCGCSYKGSFATVEEVIGNNIYVYIDNWFTARSVFKSDVLEFTTQENSHGKDNTHFGQGLPP